MLIITDDRSTEYMRIGHPERPQRVAETKRALLLDRDLNLEWAEPTAPKTEAIRRFHPAEHVAGLDRKADFDEDTPAHPGILGHALRSVGGALDVLDHALGGKTALSLLRPPGHHAIADRAQGFCYLNQIAVAALEALARGLTVAVFDFDVHHGNGTEAALAEKAGATFTSIHQFPAYPGTGRDSFKNIRNHPMAPWTPRPRYVETIERALDRMFADRPDVILVSAGFDAFRGDPLAQETLEAEDYELIGRRLRASGIPHGAVLEGGYSAELPELVRAFVRGLSG